MTTTTNRRAFTRAQEHGSYATFPGGASSVRDFSVGGAMLDDEEPLEFGSPIRLEIHVGGEVLYCDGVVKRSEPGSGMAVQFLRLTLPTREGLLRAVDRARAAESRQKMTQRLGGSVREYRATTAAQPAWQQPRQATPERPTRPGQTLQLGEILVREGLISQDQLGAAAAQQRRTGGGLVTALVALSIVEEDALVRCFQKEFRLPTIDLMSTEPTTEALKLVSYELASRHAILPIGISDSSLTVAIADPANLEGLQQVKFSSGCDVRITLAPARTLQRTIERVYGQRARVAS